MNDILQWVTVVLILAIAAIYIARRIWGKKKNPCAGCGLSEHCGSRKCDEAAEKARTDQQSACKKR